MKGFQAAGTPPQARSRPGAWEWAKTAGLWPLWGILAARREDSAPIGFSAAHHTYYSMTLNCKCQMQGVVPAPVGPQNGKGAAKDLYL